MVQYWHPHPAHMEKIQFTASDGVGNILQPEVLQGYYSARYGVLEEVPYLALAATGSQTIKTRIDY
jgi:hypothetical protein